MQARSSSNGYGRRKTERDTTTRSTGKTNSSRSNFGQGGKMESFSRDRLIYMTTCLIGQPVEVHVVDGSVFGGIFHATNEEDFGIVLKMAYLIKDGSLGQKNSRNFSSKPPSKTLIIPDNDLVQVIAKGVPLSKDGLINELKNENQLELMTDSCISQSRHVEGGRELERWVPDESDPHPELDNTFDETWNRGWDQFQANETLFGVKSTFNEELYTTKLERGPQIRELEKEAARIAHEIEGEDTSDLHLAEERGIELIGNLDMDEETRFSSVFRGADDSGYDDIEDILFESRNSETFGYVSEPVLDTHLSTEKPTNGANISSRPSYTGVVQSFTASRDASRSSSEDRKLLAEPENVPKLLPMIDSSRFQETKFKGYADKSYIEEKEKQKAPDLNEASKAEGLHRLNKESYDKASLSPNATAFDSSNTSSEGQEKVGFSTVGSVPPKAKGGVKSSGNPPYTASDRGSATSTSAVRGQSPSSSVSSLSSEKSTLNPHAKEFRLNPNAKSFVPSPTPLRPASPVADGAVYYPANMTPVTHMHGMMGHAFAGQQPVMFNPQAAALQQQYYYPNGPQFAQQMMMGQPRQVVYMPAYPQPQEMQYKGREF